MSLRPWRYGTAGRASIAYRFRLAGEGPHLFGAFLLCANPLHPIEIKPKSPR
jgi:hypothetical protein